MRCRVRNEYGLGTKELYKEGVEAEDPKAVLDGVAVSDLVGLLRQLGDLSQFAAEVFHGLQEQVASTSSRSRRLVTRVQNIEASLPSLEKAILSQTSHIHLAYMPGSEWHPHIRNEQNHFVCDDLPHFIMDSYEECREPPSLQLLDRFDTGGPGSCLKRYSDPTFFRRAAASSEVLNRDKSPRERKSRKIKKKRSSQRSGRFPNSVPNSNSSGRMELSSRTGQEQSTLSHTGSTIDRTLKPDMGDQSDSLRSKEGLDFVECVSRASTSGKADKTKENESSSTIDKDILLTSGITYRNEPAVISSYDFLHDPVTVTTVPSSSNVTWDENLELMEHMGSDHEDDIENVQHNPKTSFHLQDQQLKPVTVESIDHVDYLSEHASTPKSTADLQFPEANMNVKLMEQVGMDFLHEQELDPVDSVGNQVEDFFCNRSSPESHADDSYTRTTMDGKFVGFSGPSYLYEQEVKQFDRDSLDRVEVFSEHGSSLQPPDGQHPEIYSDGNLLIGVGCGIDEVQGLYERNFENENIVQTSLVSFPELMKTSKGENPSDENLLELVEVGCGIDEVQGLYKRNFEDESLVQASLVSFPELTETSNGENTLGLIADDYYVKVPSDSKSGKGEMRYVLENNLDNAHQGAARINADYVADFFPQVTDFIEVKDTHEMISNGKFASDPSHSDLDVGKPQSMLEANLDYDERKAETINEEYAGDTDTLSKDGNDVNVIEWHHHEDIDSETDNFVDALYTIESESESDVEGQRKNEVKLSTSESKLEENEARELEAEKTNHLEQELESHVRTFDHKGDTDDSEKVPAFASLASSESLSNSQSSLDTSEVEVDLKQDVSQWSSHEKSMESTQLSTLPNVSQGLDIRADPDDMRTQSAGFEIASRPQTLPDDRSAFTCHAPHELPFGTTSSYPVSLWTNGILFGLQPSKPTVFCMSDSMNTAPVSSNNGDVVGECSPKVDGSAGVLSSSVKDSGCGNRSGSGDQDAESSKIVSSLVSDKCDRPQDHVGKSASDQSVIHGLRDSAATLRPSIVHAGDGSRKALSEAVSLSEDRSSLLSVLGRGLLTNGVRNNGSMGYDEKNRTSSAFATNDFENGALTAESHSVPLTNLKKKMHSPVGSPPPSPPLERMKISFRPMDGLETSRLKLKYPEGLDQHDSIIDSFPSFQLIPEVTMLQHDIGSDSDVDTFCQSYPCMSEDSLSHLSVSDSEQWESGGTSESTDHALYDGFRRISSTESASSSPPRDETDQGSINVGSTSSKALHAMSTRSSQLPSLETNNKVPHDEMKVCLNPEADSSHLQEPIRQLPPLPPVDWRVSKQLLYTVEDKLEPCPGSLNQSVDCKLVESAMPHLAFVDSAKVPNRTEELDKIAHADKADELKFHGLKLENHVANGRAVAGGGDFLHQIRTKSFNLKSTETARTFYTPIAATNNKVTAILQKANAIRQAVGSDAEDDSWSDA